jgi:hypothetical protein
VSTSKNLRCRWAGNNMAELQEFVQQHGGAVEFMGTALSAGVVRMTAYLMPHGQVIRPGSWLERVTQFPASEERGWKCVITAPKPVKRTRNGRKPWR